MQGVFSSKVMEEEGNRQGQLFPLNPLWTRGGEVAAGVVDHLWTEGKEGSTTDLASQPRRRQSCLLPQASQGQKQSGEIQNCHRIGSVVFFPLAPTPVPLSMDFRLHAFVAVWPCVTSILPYLARQLGW